VEPDLGLAVHVYETDATQEHFLSFETRGHALAGFLRLSLPKRRGDGCWPAEAGEVWVVMPEIAGAAMIREVHVYGPALGIGADSSGEAQHLGLGRRLVAKAKEHASEGGFGRLAVISAIGTRQYYEAQGFERGDLYMIAPL
jgi:elongator complex protein 3